MYTLTQIPTQQIMLQRSLNKKFIDVPAMQSLRSQLHLIMYEMTLLQHPEESLYNIQQTLPFVVILLFSDLA